MNPFERFYRRHRESFFGYLYRMTANRDMAAEILQESFARYLAHYGEERCEPALLYTIGRNAALDLIRANRRLMPFTMEPADSRRNPEQDLVIRQTHQRLLNALDRMAPIDRDVLSLATSGDLNYREIGEMVGISEANVKVRVHRARMKLRTFLAEEPHEGRTHQLVHR